MPPVNTQRINRMEQNDSRSAAAAAATTTTTTATTATGPATNTAQATTTTAPPAATTANMKPSDAEMSSLRRQMREQIQQEAEAARRRTDNIIVSSRQNTRNALQTIHHYRQTNQPRDNNNMMTSRTASRLNAADVTGHRRQQPIAASRLHTAVIRNGNRAMTGVLPNNNTQPSPTAAAAAVTTTTTLPVLQPQSHTQTVFPPLPAAVSSPAVFTSRTFGNSSINDATSPETTRQLAALTRADQQKPPATGRQAGHDARIVPGRRMLSAGRLDMVEVPCRGDVEKPSRQYLHERPTDAAVNYNRSTAAVPPHPHPPPPPAAAAAVNIPVAVTTTNAAAAVVQGTSMPIQNRRIAPRAANSQSNVHNSAAADGANVEPRSMQHAPLLPPIAPAPQHAAAAAATAAGSAVPDPPPVSPDRQTFVIRKSVADETAAVLQDRRPRCSAPNNEDRERVPRQQYRQYRQSPQHRLPLPHHQQQQQQQRQQQQQQQATDSRRRPNDDTLMTSVGDRAAVERKESLLRQMWANVNSVQCAMSQLVDDSVELSSGCRLDCCNDPRRGGAPTVVVSAAAAGCAVTSRPTSARILNLRTALGDMMTSLDVWSDSVRPSKDDRREKTSRSEPATVRADASTSPVNHLATVSSGTQTDNKETVKQDGDQRNVTATDSQADQEHPAHVQARRACREWILSVRRNLANQSLQEEDGRMEDPEAVEATGQVVNAGCDDAAAVVAMATAAAGHFCDCDCQDDGGQLNTDYHHNDLDADDDDDDESASTEPAVSHWVDNQISWNRQLLQLERQQQQPAHVGQRDASAAVYHQYQQFHHLDDRHHGNEMALARPWLHPVGVRHQATRATGATMSEEDQLMMTSRFAAYGYGGRGVYVPVDNVYNEHNHYVFPVAPNMPAPAGEYVNYNYVAADYDVMTDDSSEEKFRIEVDRSSPTLLDELLQLYCSVHVTTLAAPLQIIFSGEPGVDGGALTREFYHVVFDKLLSSGSDSLQLGRGVFEGCRGHLLPAVDHVLLDRRVFWFIGVLAAQSAGNACHGLPGLCNAIRHFLYTGARVASVADMTHLITMDDIADLELRAIVVKLRRGTELIEAERTVLNQWLEDSKFSLVMSTNTRDYAVHHLLRFYVFDSRMSQLQSIAEGMDELGWRPPPDEYDLDFVFPSGLETVSLDEFFTTVRISNLSDTSPTAHRARRFFVWFCTDLHNGAIESLRLTDLLLFFTGEPYLLPGASVIFAAHDDPQSLPMARTCALELILPTVHKFYLDFKDSMTKALSLGCLGFGTV